MIRFVLPIALYFSCLVGSIEGFGLDLEAEDEDSRTLVFGVNVANTTVLGLNLSNIFPLLALLSAALLPLLCLCALAGLAAMYLLKDQDGYGSSSSYSEYSRALGFDTIDLEQLSIIDWLSIGEETFRTYDPNNLSCQTRFICEMHQNLKAFGAIGNLFAKVIGYLPYFELMTLPEPIQNAIYEFSDAADRGRSMTKDCGDIYSDCHFSVKRIHDTYFRNEIK